MNKSIKIPLKTPLKRALKASLKASLKTSLKTIFLMPILFLFTGCNVKPIENINVINQFDASRYLGTWYEIARLDHVFERELEQAKATYSNREDGGINVVNQGFNVKKQKWQDAKGKAYFLGDRTIGALKVSFFGPFYGGYNIIAIDAEYQNVLIAGPNRNYLWLLSRHKVMPTEVKNRYLEIAKKNGFATNQLIWVKQ